MRLLLLFVIFTLLSSKGVAQTSFYIRPTLSFKNNTNFGGVSILADNVKPLPNPYIYHINRKFNPAQGFDLGGAIGVQIQNKHSIELEYFREDVTLGFIGNYYVKTLEDYQGYESYSQSQEAMTVGLTTNKLGLLYRNSFFKTNSNLFEFHFNLGLGMYINSRQKDGRYKNLIAEKLFETPIKELDNGVIFEGYQYITGFSKGVSGFGLLGVGFEINTKRRNIICFDINYTQGFSRLFSNITSYKFDVDGEKKMYSTYGLSRGSALSFQISYRFQLYPWIKSKRKELQEQGVYKSRD